MARLTRTQKYADLREQMANDRETSLATEELKVYEDKLKSVNSDFNSGINRQETFMNTQPKSPVDYSSYGSFEQEIKSEGNIKISEQINNHQNEIKDDNPFVKDAIKIEDESFYDFLSSLDVPSVEEEVQEEPVAPIAEFEQPEIVKPVEVKQQEVAKPVIEKEPDIINNSEENIDDIVKQLEDDFDTLNKGYENDNIAFESQQATTINNDYLKETLREVNEHNKNDGLTTKEEIASNMVNAIRHPGQPVNANNADDEFSNTVTLEIDKVLSEFSAEQEKEQQVVEFEQAVQSKPVISQPTPVKKVQPEVEVQPRIQPQVQVEPQVKPQPQIQPQPQVQVEPQIVHPVLTKVVEEAIEIKPMEETLTQEVLDDTIPFNVSNDEEVIEEYEDDEAPNKILNIILIVLIVILLAILGVIVYYILFAKGIIG